MLHATYMLMPCYAIQSPARDTVIIIMAHGDIVTPWYHIIRQWHNIEETASAPIRLSLP